MRMIMVMAMTKWVLMIMRTMFSQIFDTVLPWAKQFILRMYSLSTVMSMVPLKTNILDNGLINIPVISGKEKGYAIDISKSMYLH